MLYSLFIYQSQSGLLIWDKSFEKQMDSRRIELFSSFFSAIQSFVKEMITSTTKGLKNIEMGNFSIKITALTKLNLDIVAITDKEDEKALNKILPRLIKLLEDHKEIFIDWDGDKSRFKILDLEIINIIQTEKTLLGSKSILDGQNEIIGQIIDKLPELEASQRDNYLKEREFLYKRMSQTTNIVKKMEIIDAIDAISQKLKDKEDVSKIAGIRKTLMNELTSTKQKLIYFLTMAKQAITKVAEFMGIKSLSELDFKDVYINLYSFSTKLKVIGRDDLSEEFRTIAQLLIDKREEKRAELSKAISRILNLPEDPDFYLGK